MKPKKIIVLLLFLLCNGFWLSAQIVNIEKKRAAQLDSVYWTGDINLGAELLQNTKKIINIHGAIRIDYTRYRHSFLSLSNYNLGRVDNDDFLNTGFQHFRYNFKINKRWTWEAFTQVQYNEQIQLQLRWLLGTGPRLALLQKEKYQMYFGALYMYEYDEEKADGEAVVFFRDHRLSNYLNIHLQPMSYFQINNITYYQPVVDRPNDFRMATETSLEMKITERLVFNTAFTLQFDSRAPDDVPKTIYSFRNGLRLKF